MPRLRSLLALFLTLAATNVIAGVDLAPRPPAPAPYSVGGHATAFAGDRFLTVWMSDMREAGTHLMGALSDRNGVRVGAAFSIATFRRSLWTRVLGVDGGFVVFWRDYGDYSTHMAEVDRSGNVTARRTLALPRHIDGDVAWNGRHFLFAIEHVAAYERSAEMLLVDRSGSIVQRTPMQSTMLQGVSVVATGDSFTVAGGGMQSLMVYRVSPAGDVTAATPLPGHRGTPVATHLGNGDVLVAWGVFDRRPAAIRTVIVTANGTPREVRIVPAGPYQYARVDGITRTAGGLRLWWTGWNDVNVRYTGWTQPLSATGEATGEPVEITDMAGSQLRVAQSEVATLVTGIDDAWQQPTRVRSAAFRADGTLATTDIVSQLPTRQGEPRIAAGGGRQLAVWNETTAFGSKTRAAMIGFDGRPGAAFDLVDNARIAADEMAWNGVDFLVVQWRGTALVATRVSGDGRRVDSEPIVIQQESPQQAFWPADAAVAWAFDRWVVVWISGRQMYGANVFANGSVSAPRPLNYDIQLAPNWTRFPEEVALAFGGNQVLLAWKDVRMPPCMMPICTSVGVPMVALLDIAGQALPHPPVAVHSGSEQLSLASSTAFGQIVLLTHGGNKVYATPIFGGGQALRPGVSRELLDYPGTIRSEIAWNGTDFVVAIRYWTLRRSHVQLRRLLIFDQLAVDMVPPAVIHTDLPDSDASPGVAALDAGAATVTVHEARPGDSARAVAYSEREFLTLGLPPGTPANVQARRYLTTYADVTWSAASGDVDGYVIEREVGPGSFVATAVVPADARRATVYLYPDGPVRVRAFNAAGYGPPSAIATAATQARRRASAP